MPYANRDSASMTRTFVVIGGGIAGLGTAHFIARRGGFRVVLFDRSASAGGDRAPGRVTGQRHSTGRSAEIFRAAADDPAVRGLAVETQELYANPVAAGLPADLEALDPVGLFVATSSNRPRWRDDLEKAGLVQFDAGDLFAQRADHFSRSGAHLAWFAGAGRVNVGLLVAALEDSASANGVEFVPDARVEAIEVEDRQVSGVRMDDGSKLESSDVVIAAGAWSGALGRAIGAPLPLRPTLRHMVAFERRDSASPTPPIVWDDDASFYVRAQGDEWWASCCDVVDVEGPPTGEYPVDQDTVRRVTSMFADHVPRAAPPRVVRAWSGYRDLTPDDRPILGPDHRIEGLHWCAGLGGHGMTIGLAAARAAARLVLGGGSPWGEHCLATRFGSEISSRC